MIKLRPISDLGTLMTWEEFLESVDGGFFIDYDGYGELATDTEVSEIVVRPSTARRVKRPEWATHVLWYNR